MTHHAGGTVTATLAVRTADGKRHTFPLDGLADAPLETYLDQRPIPRFLDQQNTTGWYWSNTGRRHLRYESYLERKWLTVFDFRSDIIGISTQPLHIFGIDHGSPWEHDPDVFVRMSDGTGCLVDVRLAARATRPRAVQQSERTRRLCGLAGLDYRAVTEQDLDPTVWANLDWLAPYRRDADFPEGLLEELLDGAAVPITIGDLIAAAGDPLIARAAVMHLCWHQRLLFDLGEVMNDDTPVARA